MIAETGQPQDSANRLGCSRYASSMGRAGQLLFPKHCWTDWNRGNGRQCRPTPVGGRTQVAIPPTPRSALPATPQAAHLASVPRMPGISAFASGLQSNAKGYKRTPEARLRNFFRRNSIAGRCTKHHRGDPILPKPVTVAGRMEPSRMNSGPCRLSLSLPSNTSNRYSVLPEGSLEAEPQVRNRISAMRAG